MADPADLIKRRHALDAAEEEYRKDAREYAQARQNAMDAEAAALAQFRRDAGIDDVEDQAGAADVNQFTPAATNTTGSARSTNSARHTSTSQHSPSVGSQGVNTRSTSITSVGTPTGKSLLQCLLEQCGCIEERNGKYHELYCKGCGINAPRPSGTNASYFNGRPGLMAHITGTHASLDKEERDALVGTRKLSSKEVERILEGDLTSIPIRRTKRKRDRSDQHSPRPADHGNTNASAAPMDDQHALPEYNNNEEDDDDDSYIGDGPTPQRFVMQKRRRLVQGSKRPSTKSSGENMTSKPRLEQLRDKAACIVEIDGKRFKLHCRGCGVNARARHGSSNPYYGSEEDLLVHIRLAKHGVTDKAKYPRLVGYADLTAEEEDQILKCEKEDIGNIVPIVTSRTVYDRERRKSSTSVAAVGRGDEDGDGDYDDDEDEEPLANRRHSSPVRKVFVARKSAPMQGLFARSSRSPKQSES